MLVNNGGERAPVDAIGAEARERGIATTVLHLAAAVPIEAASNQGIAASASEFIAIHDDDDCWEPQFLTRTLDFLASRPRLSGVATASTEVMERLDGDHVVTLTRAPFQPWVRSIQLVDMAQRNLFPPIAFLFRRTAWEAVGGFDEGLPVLGDWDFNLRILQRQDIGFLPEPLANYHIRPSVSVEQEHYGNTVTARIAAFQEYDCVIRNRMLRRDLDSGNIGLGWLVAFGRQHHAMWTMLRTLDDRTRPPSTTHEERS